ncbi:MAG TPA: hypothetical protein VNW97_07375 [Candidatus Saccharimonadales bacterium]|jgi:hypothetical protein|nr:hypothetical protein [Candidatus Saccharimonadales bacterium]
MPLTLVSPMNETVVKASAPPARLASLAGKKIGFLDISKPGGSVFLDRLEKILRERHQVADILRTKKPTFAKNAPDAVIEQLRGMDAVVEALAD